MAMLPLAPYRVLDLSWHSAGAFATKLLADLGAEVVKVERPGYGDPIRLVGPFPDDVPNIDCSPSFLYLNANKKSVTADLKTESGRDFVLRLAAESDLVVESFRPGVLDRLGLGYQTLQQVKPDTILVSISSFGQSGPYRGFRATDLTVWAMGEVPYITGTPDRAPVKTYGSQASYHAGVNGAIGALAALWYRIGSGEGRHVDVSAFESVANLIEFSLGMYECLGLVHRRRSRTATSFYPNGVQQTADGEILLSFGSRRGRDVADALGLPALNDPRFDTNAARRQNRAEFDQIFAPWLRRQPIDQVLFNMQLKAKLPIAKFNRLDQLVKDVQYLSREFFVDVEHPVAGLLRFPGPAYRFGATPFRISRPAPLLGQHDAEYRRSRPFGSFDNGLATRTVAVSDDRVPATEADRAGPGLGGSAPFLPLAGIRVVDLTRFVAGPLLTKQLADLGAEVIKVESIQVPDETRFQRVLPVWPNNDPGAQPWNTTWYFNNHNRNKIGVTLDISSGWGQELLLKLVKVSDLVIENYRPGVLERIGLEYPAFRRAAPDIVMLSMSGFGDNGPYRKFGAYGSTVEAMAGLAGLNGFKDDVPVITGMPYGDWCSGMIGTVTVIAALDHRRRTGEGQRIDLSQAEVVSQFFGEAVVGFGLTGNAPGRDSNRHPQMAPHGYYHCAGNDEWLAIAVEDDERWRRLCDLMGRPQLANDRRFNSLVARKRNEDELDAEIEAWTLALEKRVAFDLLQRSDIASGPMLNARDVLLDPHLEARRYFQIVGFPHRPGMPSLAFAKNPVVFGGYRPDLREPAPDLGEHNVAVLQGLLGCDDEEIEALAASEVIGTVPLADLDFSPTNIEDLRQAGAIAEQDVDFRRRIGLDE